MSVVFTGPVNSAATTGVQTETVGFLKGSTAFSTIRIVPAGRCNPVFEDDPAHAH
jgi:hypothetical protein